MYHRHIGYLENTLLTCLQKGGSKEPCIGNQVVHALQDVLEMLDINISIIHQVSTKGWLLHAGIQHGIADTLDGRFRFFLAKHNEEQRTLCRILWEFPRNCFQLPVANTGRPRMHDAFELEGVIQA